MSKLPIFVEPSHSTGKKSLIEAMTKAAIAAGADGIIIEVHPNPSKAKSDAEQCSRPPHWISNGFQKTASLICFP